MSTDTYQPFALCIELTSEICLGRNGISFDSWLRRARRYHEMPRSTPTADVTYKPLDLAPWIAVEDGVPLVTSGILQGPVVARPLKKIQSIRRDLDIDRIRPGRNGRIERIDVQRGPLQNRMGDLMAYRPKALWFAMVGKLDAVRAAIRARPCVGQNCALGYGEIARVRYFPIDLAAPRDVLISPDRTPMRPVPLALWNRWCGPAAAPAPSISLGRAQPPYWLRTGLTEIAVPDHRIPQWSAARIERTIRRRSTVLADDDFVGALADLLAS